MDPAHRPQEGMPVEGGMPLAVLTAPARQDELHELTARGTGAGLPFARGLHVIDFQMANLHRAGIRDVIVLQPEGAGRALQDHLRTSWQRHFRHLACLAGPVPGDPAARGGRSLRRWTALVSAIAPREVLLTTADQICDPNLADLIATHRQHGADVTVEAHPGGDLADRLRPGLAEASQGMAAEAGMVLFDWNWLKHGLESGQRGDLTLDHQMKALLEAPGRVQIWTDSNPRPYWRTLDSLDTFRVTWLDFLTGTFLPCRLPDHLAAAPEGTAQGNVRDSVVMPGASVSHRAYVSRAIIAPGAHVPDGLHIGRDVNADASVFRVTRGGTVLVTQDMLAALG